MKKAWELIQALEEGKVLSKGNKEFLLMEGKSLHKGKNLRHHLKKTPFPLEEILFHPEKWEIITVQKFGKIFADI